MDDLLLLVDQLWDQLEHQGIAQQTTVAIVSDMGRTPGYNSNDGKDHWPISSMVFMGAGVTGNQVIGATTDSLAGVNINPLTLQKDNNGIPLTAAAVHKAIRYVSGVSQMEINGTYPLEGEDLALFS